MIVKQAHVHKFDKQRIIPVLLTSGRYKAKDLIKQRVCKCGKAESYDLERTVL